MITEQQAINQLKELVSQLDESTMVCSILSKTTAILEDGGESFLDETLRDKFSDYYTDMSLYETSPNPEKEASQTEVDSVFKHLKL